MSMQTTTQQQLQPQCSQPVVAKDLLSLLELRRLQLERDVMDNNSDKSALVLPGAFNGLTARLVADGGFDACYISGAAVAASKGLPDIGVVSLGEICEVVKDVHRSSGLPILADADTGFGESEMIRRTVYDYYKSGASGFHIEDQVFPKRCGHLEGKQLIPESAMVEKIRCARETSDKYCNGNFLVCARTDARGVTGIEDAIARSCAYVDAGSHMLFPEGLETFDEFKLFSSQIRRLKGSSVYLMANMTEFGKSPSIPASTLGEIGYDVVIFPVSSLRCAMFAVKDFLSDLKNNGFVSENRLSQMQTREDLYKTLHYTPGTHWVYPSPSKSTK